jgi:hypothetical protein
MAVLTEYVEELVQEIGPRPAGSKAEQRAADHIAVRLRDAGLDTVIEEFTCASTAGLLRILIYAVAALAAFVLYFMPGLRTGAFILALIAAALLVVDYLGKNPFAPFFKKSLSQNVVARYLPQEVAAKKRKIVVVAHYDSERAKLQALPFMANNLHQLRRVIRIAVVALPLVALLTLLPLPGFVISIAVVVACAFGAVALLALIVEVVNRLMPHTLGANCNGSGIAALHGIAERLFSLSNEPRRSRRSLGARRSERSGHGDRSDHSDRDRDRSDRDRSERSDRDRDRSERSRASATDPGFASTLAAADERVTPRASMASVVDTLDPNALAFDPVASFDPEAPVSAFDPSTPPAHSENEQTIDLAPPVSRDAPRPVGSRTTIPAPPARGPARQFASATPSSASNLTQNPYIHVRKPLAEQQEQKEQQEQQEQREQQEQGAAARQKLILPQKREADGTPSWFANAKKKAEEKAEKSGTDAKDKAGYRSKFADVPTTGTALGHPETLDTEPVPSPARSGPVATVETLTALPVEPQPAESLPVAPPAEPLPAEPQPAEPTLAEPQPAEERFAKEQASAATTGEVAPIPASTSAPTPASAPVSQPTIPAPDAPRQKLPGPSLQPDFSGIDRSAFKVLPGLGANGPAVVVPANEERQGANAPLTMPPEPSRTSRASRASHTSQVSRTSQASRTSQPSHAPRPAHDEPRTSAPLGRLSALPSVAAGESGKIPTHQAGLVMSLDPSEVLLPESDSPINLTGAFAPLGATGVMRPVGEELLEYHEGGEHYIVDADDSSVVREYSETGTFSDPELVSMPSSRVRSFFGNMGDRISGKKKEKFEDAPSSWIGVDEGFDARKEGSSIGSWENFSEEEDDSWKGGAYGGTSYEGNVDAMMDLSQELLDKEVWLVALGAHGADNAGMKEFIRGHSSELRGALIINLEGVGAGELCFTIREGAAVGRNTDHRLQNLISSADKAVGVGISPMLFYGYETSASVALKEGMRAISLLGLEGKMPVGWSSSKDTPEHLSERTLASTSDVVIQLIKSN